MNSENEIAIALSLRQNSGAALPPPEPTLGSSTLWFFSSGTISP